MNTENQRLIKAELANSVSHGVGIILTLTFAPLLFIKAVQNDTQYLPLAISGYVFGLLSVFSLSTLYHAAVNPMAKYALKKLDHISIFFLIGGTYLPFVLVHADPVRAIWLLSIQWLVILIGIVNKIWFIGKFQLLSLFTYIGLGLMVLGLGRSFWESMPNISVYLLAGGGLLYLIGTIFYQIRSIKYNHFIWHLFVLSAAILHYLAVYFSM